MKMNDRQARACALGWWTALAIAALPARADVMPPSRVRVDGNIDAGIYQDLDGERNVGSIQMSNIALSGVEALGGGTAVTFRLSTRFRMQDGQSDGAGYKPFWSDEATVGVRGPAGSLRFGRGLDAAYSQDWQFDAWSYTDRVASPAWDLWHYYYPSDPHANGGAPEYGRLKGGVYYDSPQIGGLALHVSTVPSRRPGDANRPLGLSLTWQAEGVDMLLSAEKNSEGDIDRSIGMILTRRRLTWRTLLNTSAAGRSTAKALTTGIQYAAGPFIYKAGWGGLVVDRCKAEWVESVGVAYPLSAATVLYWDASFKRVPKQARHAYGMGISTSF